MILSRSTGSWPRIPPPAPWGAAPVLTFEQFELLAREVEPYRGSEDPLLVDVSFWNELFNRANELVRACRSPRGPQRES